MKRDKSILMHFDSAHDLLHAIDVLQHHKIPICEVYTPAPVHGLEDKLQIKKIRFGYNTLRFGCLGGASFTTLAFYILRQDSLKAFTTESLIELILNILIIAITFILATYLFPERAPKALELKPNDHRYLIVVKSRKNILSNEYITSLLEYSGAVELSPFIKNMIIS